MSNARKLAANLPTDGQLGNRNLIINGAMNVAQRGTSSTTTNGFGTVDRFRIWHGAVGNVATNQYNSGSNAVDGISNYSFRAQATNTASLAAGSDAHIRYVVEDKDIQNIGLTNPNNNFTLSFYVKCSNAGQSSVALTSGNFSSAKYVVPFTITSADTWQRVELTFPGNAALSNVSGGFGLRIYWDLGIGTTYQTSTHNQWITSGNPFAAAGNLQIIGVYDRWLQITGVQLEVGPQSTPFEHEPVGVTLSKCKRYFHTYGGTNAFEHLPFLGQADGTSINFNHELPVEMRAPPSLTQSGDWRVNHYYLGGYYTLSNVALDNLSAKLVRGSATISGNMSSAIGRIIAYNDINARWSYSAEL
jgi:hypothetical protein